MVGVLPLSACGGSDDSDGGADDPGSGSVADTSDESGDVDADADADGAGSNEEAQESLDDTRVSISTWMNSKKPSQVSSQAREAVS